MSESSTWEPLPIRFVPHQGGVIRCQNAFGLVFYLLPIQAVAAPAPTPNAAQEWVKQPARREPARGLLGQLVDRVKPR